MRKMIWMVYLWVTPMALTANIVFDCPDIDIEVDEMSLEIEDLSAPIEIVKVFNASYHLVYQCNGNCPEEIELDNLAMGEYYIDIQSYTQNWRFICAQQETIVIQDNGVVSCDEIDIEVVEQELIIAGLDAPNKIVKVFDVFYNVIDVCFFNCPSTKILPNLLAGIYHIDIQLYTSNWQFICGRQEEVVVTVKDEPCDDSACLGNITLNTQTEVDAFCGCPMIAGDLKIGNLGIANDITSLSNLQSIERVNGSVFIVHTELEDLKGLGNLGIIGKDLSIVQNQFLEKGDGLNNLVAIGNTFQLKENHNFKDLTGLDRWTKTKNIDFQNNDQLEKLDELAQLSNLRILSIKDHQALKELPDLIIDSLFGLTLENNTALEQLDFLKPISYIEGNVLIKTNTALTDCCGLAHLVDDDPFFGESNATFDISNNPFSCNSTTNILTTCLSSAPTCEDIMVNATTDRIMITGLTAPNEIIKVFDKNYNILFDCFGDCEPLLTINDLTEGTYRISINFYDQNWIPICESLITVDLDPNAAAISFSDRNSVIKDTPLPNFLLAPNPAFGATFLNLSTLEGQSVHLQLRNQVGQSVWQRSIEKVNRLPERINLQDFQNGLYWLQIKSAGRQMQTKKLIISNLY